MNGQQQSSACQQGIEYLAKIATLLPSQAIDLDLNLRDRELIWAWIGNSIGTVNQRLQLHLSACADCFQPRDRRSIQIVAVPLATSLGLDGFCNITTTPRTILVDVGRVEPSDWLALVAHEYAHAQLGYAGHDRRYGEVLSHLCLGLGLPQPRLSVEPDDLRHYPPYLHTADPLAFWRGEVKP